MRAKSVGLVDADEAPTQSPLLFTRSEIRLTSGLVPVWSCGTGPPILYLHSAAGLRITKALTSLAESFRIIAPVLPGFDGTDTHDGVSTTMDLAGLADELIETLCDAPCDAIGHSFGGWVAVWLAVLHPERIDQLVLEAPAGFRPEGVGGLNQEPAALARAMFAHPERHGRETKDLDVRVSNRAMVDYYHGPEATDQPLVIRLAEVQARTLIVAGTADGIVPPQAGKLLKGAIPRSSLTYIYDAAHAIESDQPERFVRVVRDFLTPGEATPIPGKHHS